MAKEQSKCASAGIQLSNDYESYKRKTPIVFSEHMRGLVTKDDLKIQHSELAMHTGAAGKNLVAFFLSPHLAFAVYSEDGSCGYIHGAAAEVLSPALLKNLEERWPIRAGWPEGIYVAKLEG